MPTVNIYDMADTWNDGATTFDAIKMDVTDTASQTASLLLNLQVGGTTIAAVRKDGAVLSNILAHITQTNSRFSWIGTSTLSWESFGTSYARFSGDDPGLRVRNTLGLCSDVGGIAVALTLDADNTFAQRNSTNAQIARWYRTFTDTSNYERQALQSGSGYFEWAAETAGTGTDNIDLRITPAGTGVIDVRNVQVSTTSSNTATLTNAIASAAPALWINVKATGGNYVMPLWATI